MNPSKFFEICKAKGITQSQIQVGKSTKLSAGLFHKEIDSFQVADTQTITACGIYNGKLGVATTQKLGKDTFEYLADQIVVSAKYRESAGLADLFKGSDKYHKKNLFNPDLESTSTEDKIKLLKEIEAGLLAYDKRIVEVASVEYEEVVAASEFYNSLGLKLKQKSNYCYIVAVAVGKDGEETKEVFDIKLTNDISKFDVKAFVKKIADGVLAKFGGAPCDSGKYPTVLRADVFSSLFDYFLESVSAEEVQKQSSFLIGKLDQKIASTKLTVEEKPLTKNVFFSYFDDEGVASQNKVVVKNGVLKTYFHNRDTAAKAGTTTTGNGHWAGAKIGIGWNNIFIKPGKVSFDELIAPITTGVFITELAGLGTGMNPRSGDFSCQAEGFLIENGKITKPLNLITLSGNLLKMLADLKGFDNNVETNISSTTCADAFIKSMSVGGK